MTDKERIAFLEKALDEVVRLTTIEDDYICLRSAGNHPPFFITREAKSPELYQYLKEKENGN